MQQHRFIIQGMHCGACVARIESALKKGLHSLESVNVDLVQEEAVVVGDIDQEQVILILKQLGYEAIGVPNVIKAYRDPDLNQDEQQGKPEYALSPQHWVEQLQWGGIIQKQLKKANAPEWLQETITWIPLSKAFWLCLMGTLFLWTNHFVFLSLLIATWMIFQGIWPVWERGLKRLFQGAPDMETLISLGTLAIYLYSLLTVFGVFSFSDSSHASDETIGYQVLPFITVPLSQMSNLIKHPGSSTGICFEAFGLIFVFYFFGKNLERAVMNWAVLNAKSLVQQQALPARVKNQSGEITEIPWQAVQPNTKLVLKKGDMLWVDGKIIEGTCWVDESTWTGETHWQEKKVGDPISSGSVVQDGMATLQVLSFPGQSKQDSLLSKVLSTQGEKPPIQRLADQIAQYFVWAMLALSLSTAGLSYTLGLSWPLILERTIAVLVVACPCAFGLATPIALRLAVSRLFEQGILVNRWNVIDEMGFVASVMLDKTGTITLLSESEEGMTVVCPPDLSHSDFVRRVATLETGSPHPLAVSLTGWAKRKNITLGSILSISESSGKGVMGEISLPEKDNEQPENNWHNNYWIVAGKPKWVQECLVKKAEQDNLFTPTSGLKQNWHELIKQLKKENNVATLLPEGQWVAILPTKPGTIDNETQKTDWQKLMLGAFNLEVTLNPTAKAAVDALKASSIEVIVLSGDNEKETAQIAHSLNVNYAANLLPEDKQSRVQNQKAQMQTQAKQMGKAPPALVAMVGDGLNDTLALAEADVSIAVSSGIDWVQSLSDVTLTTRELEVIPWMLRFSKHVRQVIKQNFFWACGFNALCVPLAMFGILNPMMASVAMSVSSVAVAINSLRVRTLLPYKAAVQTD